MAGNLFFGMFLTLYCHFNFLMCLFVLDGYISSSALSTVFLVVLGHLLSSCHLYRFQLFYERRIPISYSSCIL